MSSPDEQAELERREYKLAIARRAYLKASERAVRQGLLARRAVDALARIEEASKDGGPPDTDKHDARSLLVLTTSQECWPSPIRIDNEATSPEALRPGVHEFRGMWRPPAPPESPQDLGCHAIVCTCLELLRSSTQVRQHWETGCFNQPSFETDRRLDEFQSKYGDLL